MIRIVEIPAAAAWPLRHRVMYPGLDFESIKLPDDDAARHLGLYEDDMLVSVLSLFLRGDALQFRKFATLQDQQGKGYGTKLLAHVLREAEAAGLRRVWCNARRNAAPFYKRFGFRETAETFFKDGYEFVVMERMRGG
ncbi:MAG: GNAT family N-acetyltransferase [Chitinophagaceae bacterium]|nr:MAG: GNAT family N-acetyltransferase [Chitinophagaceae bacterium]